MEQIVVNKLDYEQVVKSDSFDMFSKYIKHELAERSIIHLKADDSKGFPRIMICISIMNKLDKLLKNRNVDAIINFISTVGKTPTDRYNNGTLIANCFIQQKDESDEEIAVLKGRVIHIWMLITNKTELLENQLVQYRQKQGLADPTPTPTPSS